MKISVIVVGVFCRVSRVGRTKEANLCMGKYVSSEFANLLMKNSMVNPREFFNSNGINRSLKLSKKKIMKIKSHKCEAE